MSDLHLCNCMYEHALVPKGRWVPWCVAHGSAAVKGRSGATWCEYVALRAMGECVWHPQQGAFIPDVEGGVK